MKRAAPQPAELLAPLGAATGSRLALLTGGRGSSKTRWCLAVREAAHGAGLDIAGVISPPVYADGGKAAIDIMDARTAGLGWRFDAAALAWGDGLLENAPACDLLLVDELGPLEFRGEGGFRHGFAAVEARRYRLALVVVRPELLAAAIARWPWMTIVYDKDLP